MQAFCSYFDLTNLLKNSMEARKPVSFLFNCFARIVHNLFSLA